jgi:carboxypeptidase family protein/TonB-dependent receptor-like protein
MGNTSTLESPMIRKSLQPFAALCAFVVLWPAGHVRAQGVSTGAITGTVTDAAGAPIGGAQVVAINRSTGYQTGTLSRSNGLYLIQGLEVGGPYAVRVEIIGHRSNEITGVTVALSQSTRVDVHLSQQAVELAALEINADRGSKFSPSAQGIATRVSNTLVQRVPSFSRDFVDLLRLSPQVVFPALGAPSGAGAYNRYNTITVDGANQSERFNLASTGGVPGGGSGGKIVSIDAVKEFSVMFTPTDVRLGNFAGMLVNAVTKSGTNDFRGGGSFTYRNNSDFAGVELVGKDLRASDFDVKQYSFHIGGPLIRDRLHFFIAPEFQTRARPALGPYFQGRQPQGFGQIPAVPVDSLDEIARIMRDRYGLNVGSVGSVSNENPLTNLFARLDFQLSQNHRIVLRQIMNRATDDVFFRTIASFQNTPLSQNQGFRFGSNGYAFETTSNSTAAHLYSNFTGGKSNELIVGYSMIDAERQVPVHSPEIGVGVNIGGTVRAVTLGTEQFSPGNLLTQDVYEVVNNLTIPLGDHTFTVGGRFDQTNIFNNFAQASYGVYTFPTIAALAAGTPSGYAVGYANSRNSSDIPADFRVRLYSLYAQDQWAVTDRLTVSAGLRADIPNLLDRPSQNDTITKLLAAAGNMGVRTDAVPKTRVLWSPRVGFNYDPTGDQRNQIRGGVGVFTGPPPYILLGNAYANTGLGLVRLDCRNAQTPAFTVDIENLPTSCAESAPPAAGSAGTLGINITDPDFKYPQYFGVSAGFDRQLPFNTVLTVEGLYRKAINGVLIRDANFKGPRLADGQPYRDRDGRVLYADTIPASGTVAPGNVVKQRFLTDVRGVAFNEGIIEVTNQSRDFNYSISTQLSRRFSARLEATVAYTYMKSEDVQSLTSDRAISNWRNGRQLSGAHEDLETTTSVFSRPHRLLAYGTYTLPWKLTDVTLYYERSSGPPFMLVAQGDLNGDLWNGNDPIYIPRDATDPAEIRIGSGIGTAFVQNTVAAQAFERFIGSLDCLDRQRGRIMERNSCRAPAQDRLDISIRQAIPQVRGQQLSLQLDVFNFLNLLNDNWGLIRLPTLNPTFTDQRALIQTGRNPGSLNESIPTFTFANQLYNTDPAKGPIGDPLPFEGRLGNVYQIQLTLRYTF